MSNLPENPSIIELTGDLASHLTTITTGLQMVKTALQDGADEKIKEEVMGALVGVGFAIADAACKTAMVKLAVVGAVARILELDYGNVSEVTSARSALPLLKEYLKPEQYAALAEHVNASRDGAPLNA